MFIVKCNEIAIRDFTETDIDNKIKWINDEKNNKFLHYDIPLNKEKTVEWFRNKAKNRLDCVIEYKNVPVGLVGLLNIDNHNKKAEFYISMGETSYKRKGIAEKTSRLFLNYSFSDLNLNKVYLNVDEENIAARNLYAKLGFELEGKQKEDLLHKGKLINRLRYAIFAPKQTDHKMNILILSAGTRNKIIQYFKREIGNEGKVIATDCSEIAPAIYEADKYYIVPRITEPGYIEVILDICRKEKVNGILSLIDPELSILAGNKDKFFEIGTTVIGSSYDVCERTLNKWEMYKCLEEKGYRCAKTYIDKDKFYKDIADGKICYPVFVKPMCGSASIAISKVYDKETIDLLFAHNDNLIIQEFLDGQEIGADCYIDMLSGEMVSVFTKKKIVMRAGETDKAVSVKDQALFSLISKFCADFGFAGQIDIDIFEIEGEYYISEVNPRFGGGYPHAYECGVNHMKLIVNNLKGVKNSINIGNYEDGLYMMKYNEIKIVRK